MSRVTGPDALPECPYCGLPFAPHRPNQRFCHPSHKDAYHRERREAALRAYSNEGQEKNPAAVALGRLGGLARARKLREMGR